MHPTGAGCPDAARVPTRSSIGTEDRRPRAVPLLAEWVVVCKRAKSIHGWIAMTRVVDSRRTGLIGTVMLQPGFDPHPGSYPALFTACHLLCFSSSTHRSVFWTCGSGSCSCHCCWLVQSSAQSVGALPRPLTRVARSSREGFGHWLRAPLSCPGSTPRTGSGVRVTGAWTWTARQARLCGPLDRERSPSRDRWPGEAWWWSVMETGHGRRTSRSRHRLPWVRKSARAMSWAGFPCADHTACRQRVYIGAGCAARSTSTPLIWSGRGRYGYSPWPAWPSRLRHL